MITRAPDHPRTKIDISVGRAHAQVREAQRHGAEDSVKLGDVGEQVVTLVVDDHLARCCTAAFWHIGGHEGLNENNVFLANGHQAITVNLRVGST